MVPRCTAFHAKRLSFSSEVVLPNYSRSPAAARKLLRKSYCRLA
jgi:hypothetical protein